MIIKPVLPASRILKMFSDYQLLKGHRVVHSFHVLHAPSIHFFIFNTGNIFYSGCTSLNKFIVNAGVTGSVGVSETGHSQVLRITTSLSPPS